MSQQLRVNLIPEGRKSWSDLLGYFEERFDKAVPRSQIATVAGQVMDDFVYRHVWRFRRGYDVITLEAGRGVYQMPADFSDLDGIPSITGRGSLVFVDATAIRAKESHNVGRRRPEVATWVGEASFRVWPIPDATYELGVDYLRRVSTVAEDSEDVYPPFPIEFMSILERGVEEKLRMDDDRWDAATTQSGRTYEERIRRRLFMETKGTVRRMGAGHTVDRKTHHQNVRREGYYGA